MFSDLTKIYEKRGYVGGGGVKALLKIPLQKSFWEELTFLIDILLNHGSKCLISDELSPKYLKANQRPHMNIFLLYKLQSILFFVKPILLDQFH